MRVFFGGGNGGGGTPLRHGHKESYTNLNLKNSTSECVRECAHTHGHLLHMYVYMFSYNYEDQVYISICMCVRNFIARMIIRDTSDHALLCRCSRLRRHYPLTQLLMDCFQKYTEH